MIHNCSLFMIFGDTPRAYHTQGYNGCVFFPSGVPSRADTAVRRVSRPSWNSFNAAKRGLQRLVWLKDWNCWPLCGTSITDYTQNIRKNMKSSPGRRRDRTGRGCGRYIVYTGMGSQGPRNPWFCLQNIIFTNKTMGFVINLWVLK